MRYYINRMAKSFLANAYSRLEVIYPTRSAAYVNAWMVLMYLPILFHLTLYRLCIGESEWRKLPKHIRQVY